jgi:FkbM family methyltransferase
MNQSRRKLEELTWVFGVHSAAVRLHRMVRNTREESVRLSRFYSSLLAPDSLVFDIGANVGMYSDALEASGSHVIAVEPNPDCVRHIVLTYQGRNIETLQAAVGPKNGVANLNVSDGRDDASTLVHGDGHVKWDKSVPVPVLTLDSLIDHFGLPAYIKIDVEGFEAEALKGLSVLPRLLSFEFHHLYTQRARESLNCPLFAESRVCFNVTDESGYNFELPEWVDLTKIKEVSETIIAKKTYRDIYVRSA